MCVAWRYSDGIQFLAYHSELTASQLLPSDGPTVDNTDLN